MLAFANDARGNPRTRTLDESHPAWMPDGRLSFSRHGESGPIELWALNVETRIPRRLPTNVQPVFVFDWKPT